MSDTDLERRLHELGAALRAFAPDRPEAARALTTVQEVPPSQRRWVTPALIAGIAAGLIGLLVWFARPDDVPEPNPPAAPTPSSGRGAEWRISGEDWDGRGGQCVTVTSDGETATGCVEGNRRRLPLWAAIGDDPIVVEPTGAGYTLGRVTYGGDIECNLGALVPGRLHEVRCGSVVQQIRLLPSSPDRDFVPVGGDDSDLQFDPVRVDGVRGVTAYLSRAGVGEDQCLVVLADDRAGWREACTDFSVERNLAIGVGEAMWIVHVSARGTEGISIASAATSASIHGCGETMPKILRRLDPSSMVDGLVCSGDSGMVTSPVQLASSWAGSDIRPAHACIGDDRCGERAATARPLPIAPGAGYRPATDDLIGIDELTPPVIRSIHVPADADARGIGRAVSSRFTDPSEPDRYGESIEVIDEHLLVLVGVPVLDDTAAPDTYAVWLDSNGGRLTIDRVFRIRTCARGVVDTDGGPACV
jgi:hypothetical protein